jgi:hypothetical protein
MMIPILRPQAIKISHNIPGHEVIDALGPDVEGLEADPGGPGLVARRLPEACNWTAGSELVLRPRCTRTGGRQW